MDEEIDSQEIDEDNTDMKEIDKDNTVMNIECLYNSRNRGEHFYISDFL